MCACQDFIHLKCRACGAVSDVDMRHKLNTFILKNPPEVKMSKEEKKLKKARRGMVACWFSYCCSFPYYAPLVALIALLAAPI